MYKDFDSWNKKKKPLELEETQYKFNAGEIWWCSIGINLGQESCGKGSNFRRPVLILKKLSRRSFIGVPISTQIKIGSWFYHVIHNRQEKTILLNQIRMFSTNRFQHKMDALSNHDFAGLKQKLKRLLEL